MTSLKVLKYGERSLRRGLAFNRSALASRPSSRSVSLTSLERTVLSPIQSRKLSTSSVLYDDNDDDKNKPEKKSDDGEDEIQEEPLVLIERMENFKIMSIGINRPEKRNCVNEATAKELYKAFNEFEEDEEMCCAVLHGIGGNFCAGYDLSELADIEADQVANTIVRKLTKHQKSKT